MRAKALISYLADLYSEGLINENAITNDYSMFQSLSRGDENGDALVGVVLGWEETDKFGPTLHDQHVPCPDRSQTMWMILEQTNHVGLMITLV